MTGPTPEAPTPGQAAYEGMCRHAIADDGPPGRSEAWEKLEPWQRARWDAAAAAASQAALPKVLAAAARYKAERDAARAEVNRLGDLLGVTSNAKCDAIAERDEARAENASLRADRDAIAVESVTRLAENEHMREELAKAAKTFGQITDENASLRERLARQDADFEPRLAVLDDVIAERDDWHEAADGWEGNFHAARNDADRYRAALERAVRVLRGEGIEVMDDAELAAVIARALSKDGTRHVPDDTQPGGMK